MKRRWILLPSIILVAVTLRMGFYVIEPPLLTDADAGGYLLHIRDGLDAGLLHLGHFVHRTIPPLYPYLAAWTASLVGDVEVGARVLSTIAGIGLVAVVYTLGMRLYNCRVALVAAAFAAVHPALIQASFEPYLEALYVTLVYAAMLVMLRALENPSRGRLMATGALFAGAYLTRPEGFMFLVLAPALYVVVSPLFGRPLRRSVAPAAVVMATFLLAAAPYLVSLRSQLGYWTFNGRTTIMADLLTNEQDGALRHEQALYGIAPDEIQPAAGNVEPSAGRAKPSMVHAVLGRPLIVAQKAAHNLDDALRYVAPAILAPVLAALVGLGLIAAPWTVGRLRSESVLWGVVGPSFLVAVAWDTEVRHYLMVVPVLMLWGAAGTDVLIERAGHLRQAVSRWRPRWTAKIPAAAFATAVLLVVAGDLLRVALLAESRFTEDYATTTAIEKDFGQWMKANLPERRPVVAARKPFLALYAGARNVMLPYGTLDDVVTSLKSSRVDYLYLNETRLNLRPQLAPLLDGSKPHASLDLVHRDLRFDGARLVLFRVQPDAGDPAGSPAP